MNNFSKTERAEIDEITSDLSGLSDTLDKAVDAYNAAMAEPKEAVETALAAYNARLADLRGLYEELRDRAADYHGGRSEKWQEGEKGQAYQEWIDSMTNISGVEDDATIDFPEDVEFPSDIPDWNDPSFLPESEPNEV